MTRFNAMTHIGLQAKVNPLHFEHPKMSTFVNIEGPHIMQQNAAFQQGLHFLPRLKKSP